MKQAVFGTILLMLCCAWAPAKLALDPATLTLPVGGAMQLKVNRDNARELKWTSENVKAAGVYVNGFVVGLTPGEAIVHVSAPDGEEAACRVKVTSGESELVNPATLQQYSDNRVFYVGKSKCVGSVLNGHMVGNDAQKSDRNRVLNPKPLRKDQPLEWELVEGTPIYDGTGAVMGTAAPDLDIGGRKVANTRFNYGFSKVVKGRFCVYGFVVSMKPDASMVPLLDAESRKQSIVNTSAWVPLDAVTTTLQVGGVTAGAPHPNAGRLFLDFITSRAGQEIFREANYIPMHPDVPAKDPMLKAEPGGYKQIVLSPEEVDTNAQRYQKIYQDIFR